MTEVGDVVSLIQGTCTGGELEQSPQPLVWYNAHSSQGTIEVTNVEIALLFLPTLPSPRRLKVVFLCTRFGPSRVSRIVIRALALEFLISVLFGNVLVRTYSGIVMPKVRRKPSSKCAEALLLSARGAPGKSLICLLFSSKMNSPSCVRNPVFGLWVQSAGGLRIRQTCRPFRSLIEAGSEVQSYVTGL